MVLKSNNNNILNSRAPDCPKFIYKFIGFKPSHRNMFADILSTRFRVCPFATKSSSSKKKIEHILYNFPFVGYAYTGE